MKFKNSVLILPVSLLLSSCGNNVTIEENSVDSSIKANDEKTLALLESKCFICHNPNLDANNRLAPPIFKIREHYYDDEISRVEFIKEIVAFVNDPSEKRSIMPGAVRNFGLMPKQQVEAADLELIAAYLYDNDVASDEWYTMWEKRQKSKNASVYIEKGAKIASDTKDLLGINLIQAMQNGGPENAVEFCKLYAINLTDSMSVALKAKVKRVSDRPRNPLNSANDDEKKIMERYNLALTTKQTIKPELKDYEDHVIAYYPILTNNLCLKCHGTMNKELSPKTLAVIKKHYPNDKGTGYATDQLRGLFVVEMNKN